MAYTPVQGGTVGDASFSGYSVASGSATEEVISGNDYLAARPNGLIPPDHPAHLDMDALTIQHLVNAVATNSEIRTELQSMDIDAFKNTTIRFDIKNSASAGPIRFKYLTSGAFNNFLEVAGSQSFSDEPIGYPGYIAAAADPKDTTSLMKQWAQSGDPADFTDIQRIVIQITGLAAAPANPVEIWIFDWLVDYQDSTIVELSVDDGHESQFTDMFPLNVTHNIPISCAIIFDALDTANILTTAQLDVMFASSVVDVCGHSAIDFTTQTQLQVETYLDDVVIPGLVTYASKGGEGSHAYANGGFQLTSDSAEIRDIMASRGFAWARTTQTANWISQTSKVDQQLKRPALAMGQDAGQVIDSTTALAEVDRAIAAGLNISFNSHQFVSGAPSGGLEWNTTEYGLFLAGLDSRRTSSDITVKSFVENGLDFGYLTIISSAPTLTTPYSDVSGKVGDSYGPVDYTSNTLGADSYSLSGFPDGIDVSDPAAVAGTFLRYGKSYPGINATNEFGFAPQNHFTFDITQEFTVSTSDVLDTSVETPQDIIKPDGHSIFGSGFAHNFVGVTYYSDSAGLISVDQSAVTGTSVVTVATVETPDEQDAIPTEGATGKRWSFAGNPTKGQIAFTTISNGAFARVRTRQNKT